MGKFVISWTLLLTWSLTSAQFLYNYEPEQVQAPPASDAYDSSQYRYNPPSTVQQHFVQPVESPRLMQRAQPAPPRQHRIQSQPQVQYEPESQPQYEPQPQYQPQPQNQPQQQYQPQPQQQQLDPQYQPPPESYEPANQPQYQNTRRVSRKRQRTRVTAVGNYQPQQEIKPPIQYAPSIFENFALGQAPDGVHIPQDSLLNTLLGKKPQRQQSSPPQQSHQIQPQQEPLSPVQQYQQRYQAPQQTQPRYVSPPVQQQPQHYQQPQQANSQPAVQYQQPVEQPQQYFVQPPAPQQQVQYRQQAQPVQEFRQPRRPRAQQVQQQQRPPVAQVQPPRRQQQPAPQYQQAPQPQVLHRAPEPAYNADYEDFEDDLVRERAPAHNHRQRQEVRASSQTRPRQQLALATAAPQVRQATTFKPANLAIATLPDDTDGDGIPGQAAVDYPTLHVIPTTSFSCAQQPHNGYYADMETSCQVVHLCQFGGEQDSFLCPNGTIFSQEKFSCQWWYKVNCADSPRYYGINDNLYKVPDPSGRGKK